MGISGELLKSLLQFGTSGAIVAALFIVYKILELRQPLPRNEQQQQLQGENGEAGRATFSRWVNKITEITGKDKTEVIAAIKENGQAIKEGLQRLSDALQISAEEMRNFGRTLHNLELKMQISQSADEKFVATLKASQTIMHSLIIRVESVIDKVRAAKGGI